MLPKVGLVACNSGASNTGTLTGRVAMEVVKETNGEVGICSLPALVNEIPRQTALVKRIPHLIVIDGCHNECAKKILNNLCIDYEVYINLENDFQIKKKGPFTSLDFSDENVEKIKKYVLEKIKEMLNND